MCFYLFSVDKAHTGQLQSGKDQLLDPKSAWAKQQIIWGGWNIVVIAASCITIATSTRSTNTTHASIHPYFWEVPGKIVDEVMEQHVTVVLGIGIVGEVGLSHHFPVARNLECHCLRDVMFWRKEIDGNNTVLQRGVLLQGN